MAEVADVHKLPQQLATLLDEVVVIAGRHARLHLYPDTGNRYRSENMAFLNSSQSRRAPSVKSALDGPPESDMLPVSKCGSKCASGLKERRSWPGGVLSLAHQPDFGDGTVTIFASAFSSTSGSSSAPTSFAVSTNRLYCSGSSGFGAGFLLMGRPYQPFCQSSRRKKKARCGSGNGTRAQTLQYRGFSLGDRLRVSRFISYRRHRFPPVIIQHAVWLYCRFTLSYRDVEDLLAERGLDISYETVRRWVLKFGRAYARRIQRRRPRPTERWHLDEMVVVIRGRQFYLWRAVDSEGEVLDFLVQSRRNARSAIRLMRKLLKKQGFAPATIVTDKLRSYGTAIRLLTLSAQHEQGLRKNNRAENSHQPVRRRERKMQRFKSPASAQRFLAVHATVYNLFNVQRHLVSRRTLRQFRGDAMRQWRQVTTVA